MELKQLQAFYLVGRYGSLGKAANYLKLTPSAISIQLKKLEAELMVKIFDRRPNKLALTEKGRVLLREVRNVLDALTHMRESIGETGNSYGEKIAIAFGRNRARTFAPQIAAFKQKNPRLQISIHSKTSTEAIAMLLEGTLDLAISSLRKVPRGIQKRKLLDNKLYLIFHRRHILSGKPIISLADVAVYPMVLHPRGVTTRQIIETGFAAQGIDLQNILEVGHCESIVEFVRLGLGVGFVHGICLPNLRQKNIKRYDMTEAFERLELSVIHRKTVALKASQEALLEALIRSVTQSRDLEVARR